MKKLIILILFYSINTYSDTCDFNNYDCYKKDLQQYGLFEFEKEYRVAVQDPDSNFVDDKKWFEKSNSLISKIILQDHTVECFGNATEPNWPIPGNEYDSSGCEYDTYYNMIRYFIDVKTNGVNGKDIVKGRVEFAFQLNDFEITGDDILGRQALHAFLDAIGENEWHGLSLRDYPNLTVTDFKKIKKDYKILGNKVKKQLWFSLKCDEIDFTGYPVNGINEKPAYKPNYRCIRYANQNGKKIKTTAFIASSFRTPIPHMNNPIPPIAQLDNLTGFSHSKITDIGILNVDPSKYKIGLPMKCSVRPKKKNK